MPDLVIFHQITVRQMMAIIHECDLVIDNDSSPSHIATALGIPTIVLFSQAIREIFRPYGEKKDHHFVFYNDVHCRECELTTCDNRICLEFSPDEVYTQALKMLSSGEA
jgi:ADP-heptose:LPS heptosyltransferase